MTLWLVWVDDIIYINLWVIIEVRFVIGYSTPSLDLFSSMEQVNPKTST